MNKQLFKKHKRITNAVLCILALILLSFIPLPFHISDNGNGYDSAVVVKPQGKKWSGETISVRLLSGPEKGQIKTASIGALTISVDVRPPHYQEGDKVLVNHGATAATGPQYVVIDHFRLPLAGWLFAFLVLLAIYFAGWRGVGALFGLALSLVIIGKFVIPAIIAGHNPYVVTSLGIFVITFLGIFIAHGFSRRTVIALISAYITLLLAVGFAALATAGLHLTGVASESAYYLGNRMPQLFMPGLLLCGIIISIVGILDDMTVGQATAIEEIHKANPKLNFSQLYGHGIKIGREHIASLINTLILAFVGSSFIFIFFITATSTYPLLININSEMFMQEITRSLVGSCALILAVPITTLLAARFLVKRKPPIKAE